MTDTAIDYEELVRTYTQDLTTALRGFRSGEEFLETWVPDDDPHLGILSLIEAADAAGRSGVVISLGPATRSAFDLDRLIALTADLAAVAAEPAGDSLILRARCRPAGGAGPAPVDGAALAGVHPAFRERLAAYLGVHRHAGPLWPTGGRVRIAATVRGVTLTALVDPAKHIICRATYQGDLSAADAAILEALCWELAGRPILDAGEHAVGRVVEALREPSRPRPVAGILLPENADPIFGRPVELGRELVAAYRESTAFRETLNTYEPPPGPDWLALTAEDRAERVRWALDRIAAELDLPAGAISLLTLDGPSRIVLDIQHADPAEDPAPRLLSLESRLKAALDASLYLQAVDRQDENKLRQKG